jgi:hypothetical protein
MQPLKHVYHTALGTLIVKIYCSPPLLRNTGMALLTNAKPFLQRLYRFTEPILTSTLGCRPRADAVTFREVR